jgi:hypothetical protein
MLLTLALLSGPADASGGWFAQRPDDLPEGVQAPLGPVGSGFGLHVDVAGGYSAGAVSRTYARSDEGVASVFEYGEGRNYRLSLGLDMNETLDLVLFGAVQDTAEQLHYEHDNTAIPKEVSLLQPQLGAELRVVHRRFTHLRPYAGFGLQANLTGDWDLLDDDGTVNWGIKDVKPGLPWWLIPGVRCSVGVDLRPRGERSLTALFIEATGTHQFYPYGVEEAGIFFDAARKQPVNYYGVISAATGLRFYPHIGQARRDELPPLAWEG